MVPLLYALVPPVVHGVPGLSLTTLVCLCHVVLPPQLELQVDFHPYPGVQHTLAPTETDDMIRWLQEHFPAEN